MKKEAGELLAEIDDILTAASSSYKSSDVEQLHYYLCCIRFSEKVKTSSIRNAVVLNRDVIHLLPVSRWISLTELSMSCWSLCPRSCLYSPRLPSTSTAATVSRALCCIAYSPCYTFVPPYVRMCGRTLILHLHPHIATPTHCHTHTLPHTNTLFTLT